MQTQDFSFFANRRTMLGVVFANNFIKGDIDCEPELFEITDHIFFLI